MLEKEEDQFNNDKADFLRHDILKISKLKHLGDEAKKHYCEDYPLEQLFLKLFNQHF